MDCGYLQLRTGFIYFRNTRIIFWGNKFSVIQEGQSHTSLIDKGVLGFGHSPLPSAQKPKRKNKFTLI